MHFFEIELVDLFFASDSLRKQPCLVRSLVPGPSYTGYVYWYCPLQSHFAHTDTVSSVRFIQPRPCRSNTAASPTVDHTHPRDEYQIVVESHDPFIYISRPPWTSRQRNLTSTRSRWDGQTLPHIIMHQCITLRSRWPGQTHHRHPPQCRNGRDQLPCRGCCCPGKSAAKRPETSP